MARPPIIWLVPDPHFHHELLVRGNHRPADFTKRLSSNMKDLVKQQDMLIVLGDVIFRHKRDLISLLPSMGVKILTLGNHDKESRWWYMRNGFNLAVDTFTMGEIMFSHVPQKVLPAGIKFNVHGHLHTQTHRNPPDWYDHTKYLCLCLEGSDYKPFNLSRLLPNAKTSLDPKDLIRFQQ